MFTIQLKDVNEVNVVLAGLGKLPLEVSVPVWASVREQAEKQASQKDVTFPKLDDAAPSSTE